MPGQYFGPGTKVGASAYGWARVRVGDLNGSGGRGPYANASAQPCAELFADTGDKLPLGSIEERLEMARAAARRGFWRIGESKASARARVSIWNVPIAPYKVALLPCRLKRLRSA